MSDLVVIVFDRADEAPRLYQKLNELRHEGFLSLDDAAVVVKDVDGQVHVKNEIDRGIKIGFAGGGVIGLILGFIFGGPIGTAILGAVGGAIAGSLSEMGVRSDFVDEVKQSLRRNHSALFMIIRHEDPEVVIAALKPYKGKIIQSTLPTEAEESLRHVLEQRV